MISFFSFDLLVAYLWQFISTVIFTLLTIAFFTLLERKVLSSIQRRRGPNLTGTFGFLQPFADALKLLLKELLYTSSATIYIFLITPVITLSCTLLILSVITSTKGYAIFDLPFPLLVILSISSLSVHGIIFAGWASNSKYAFLGGVRSAAQMISYELCICTIFVGISVMAESYSIVGIVDAQRGVWYIFPLLPFFIIFLICALAETNRSPFDLPEAESELVAGYNVEYSAIVFALFFLAEYGNMFAMSSLSTIFFFGGWNIPFVHIDSFFFLLMSFNLKVNAHIFFFIWIRASVPRYRYDQLMAIGWRTLLPATFFLLMCEITLIVIRNFFL